MSLVEYFSLCTLHPKFNIEQWSVPGRQSTWISYLWFDKLKEDIFEFSRLLEVDIIFDEDVDQIGCCVNLEGDTYRTRWPCWCFTLIAGLGSTVLSKDACRFRAFKRFRSMKDVFIVGFVVVNGVSNSSKKLDWTRSMFVFVIWRMDSLLRSFEAVESSDDTSALK